MNYLAKKIYVTCDQTEVGKWAAYMKAHMDEVRQSLVQEGVRHEAWYLGEDEGGFYLIGVMDVDDQDASAKVAATSTLSIDQVHRAFKKHWDRSRVTNLRIIPDQRPTFDTCELLLDVQP